MGLYGILGLNDHAFEELLLSKLHSDLGTGMETNLDPIEALQSVVQTLHLMDRSIPTWLTERQIAYEAQRFDTHPDRRVQGELEFRVWAKIKQWMKEHGKEPSYCAPSLILDGFEMDFYFEALGLCLEIDGRHHLYPTQQSLDQKRDAYLLERHGVTTVRLSTSDDIINDLDFLMEHLQCVGGLDRPLT